MQPFPETIVWHLPAWFGEGMVDHTLVDDTRRMQAAIALARRSVQRGGGPFGALVVEAGTGRVIAAAANLVVQGRCSLLHAEVVALAAAQKRVESFTLSEIDAELVSSSEPCAQCLGAVLWSGVKRLVCGAWVEDAVAVGFDEGPRRDDWQLQLRDRGIAVTSGLMREEARRVLQEYQARGGVIYNGSS